MYIFRDPLIANRICNALRRTVVDFKCAVFLHFDFSYDIPVIDSFNNIAINNSIINWKAASGVYSKYFPCAVGCYMAICGEIGIKLCICRQCDIIAPPNGAIADALTDQT